MKLSGTSVVAISEFLENLKTIAGTKFLTRLEYDKNPNKICSFSYVTKLFHYTWNECLEKAQLKINRKLPNPSTQGRKLKDSSKYKEVSCLRCDKMFVSSDPCNFRICDNCKNMLKLIEGDE